jgi:OOP family OmpA-OmpF porin
MFNQTLHAAYLERAQHELAENHYVAADHFTGKANAVARDEDVDPAVLANWDLPPETVGDLAAARDRLVSAKAKVLSIESTARTGLPRRTGRAQMLFDCWVEEQEENVQPRHIASCRNGFEDLMAQIEPYLVEPPPPMMKAMPMAEPAPMPEPVMPAPPQSYLVFFDWDRSDLTAEALSIVRTAAGNANRAGYNVIEIIGHADRSGPDQYNMGLSERRAIAVRRELERQGIVPGGTSVYAKGEHDPLVATPDGVREPQNRRAEILLK